MSYDLGRRRDRDQGRGQAEKVGEQDLAPSSPPAQYPTRPSGMPGIVAMTSQVALRKWTGRQSCATMTAAIVMESNTASGAQPVCAIKNHGLVARATTAAILSFRELKSPVPSAPVRRSVQVSRKAASRNQRWPSANPTKFFCMMMR
jgi:hypothetical protein